MKNLVLLLTLTSWPISLFLENTSGNFLGYILPLILIGFFALTPKSRFANTALLAIPFIEPKLILLPLLTFLICYTFSNSKPQKIYIILSLILTISFAKTFYNQSIFKYDYQAQQKVIRDINLYPHPLLARFFQNKLKIRIEKFNERLFILADPNNYFFSSHPREIQLSNQNLHKFPTLSIIFAIVGFLNLSKLNNYKTHLSILLAGIINLSLLTNFDRHDIILYLPLSFIIINGINLASQNKYFKYFAAFYIPFTIFDLVRIIYA